MASSCSPPLVGLLLSALLISGVTQFAEANKQTSREPPRPVFADNYHVRGVLSLPYAELNEPFEAYFDKQSERSRADYYGGEYKVFQFGPKSSPDGRSSQFGSIYKLVYVPKAFKTPEERQLEPVEASARPLGQLLGKAFSYAASRLNATGEWALHLQEIGAEQGANLEADADAEADEHEVGAQLGGPSQTPVKRVCFGVKGGVGFTVRPQTVLPELSNFKYESTGPCPHPERQRKPDCELWKYSNEVGAKKNTYKFWLRREANQTIPVHYYMLGFDSLLGSHYDRYDISYWNYAANEARERDFSLDVEGHKCGPMPGPGEAASQAEKRAHLAELNPLHQFVEAPHVYEHIDHHFAQFRARFPKEAGETVGGAKEERRSWFNFMHNLRFIHGKNRELSEFKLAVNKFADASKSDLRYLRGRLHSTGYNGGLDYEQHRQRLRAANSATSAAAAAADKLPDYFDWTALGGVTPVKDQAVCGSCWSFGTVGALEGSYFARTGKLLRLSQQQLVDCSWQFGNNGCDGGEDFRAYKYVMSSKGLATEEEYGHYKGIDGRCHDRDVSKPVTISGFYNVTANSVEALQHAIVHQGPVSISIDASQPTFTFYSHGAYFDPKCANSPDSLDHSVLAVGYMRLNGQLVWKVKNSWSTYWGNDGYIYMLARDNNCGVLDAPTVPIVSAAL